jgi:hypothetical protein
MRLDKDKLEALRHWPQGLQQTGSEEYSAAGRAILMLIEEIEQLHIALADTREQLSRVPAVPHAAAADTGAPLAPTLQGRLQRALKRDSASSSGSRPEPVVEESGSGLETDRTPTSAQAWIETLRRQE